MAKGSTGQRRYHAFVAEARRDGLTPKEARAVYHTYKDGLGHIPKRGEYKKFIGYRDMELARQRGRKRGGGVIEVPPGPEKGRPPEMFVDFDFADHAVFDEEGDTDAE